MKCMALLALLILGSLLSFPVSCAGPDKATPTPTPEPTIPPHFTTYRDELGLFSISYPPHWDTAMSLVGPVRQWCQDVLDSIESGISLDEVKTVFAAGVRTTEGFLPNVNINVFSTQSVWTLDAAAEAAIGGLRDLAQEYHEYSRVRTLVGSKEAIIIDYEATWANLGTHHNVCLLTLVGNTAWSLTCSTTSEQFAEQEDDLNAIARSLRIWHSGE